MLPDSSSGAKEDINIQAFLESQADLLQQFPGQFVAFVNGVLAGHSENEEELVVQTSKQFQTTDIFYRKVVETEPIIKIRSPRKIRP